MVVELIAYPLVQGKSLCWRTSITGPYLSGKLCCYSDKQVSQWTTSFKVGAEVIAQSVSNPACFKLRTDLANDVNQGTTEMIFRLFCAIIPRFKVS